ncbi:MAG: PTS sugar transporter subunit IIC [Gemmatimonadetes bacterium]|nr:PTS sugar transporter subunit IIC [Gemmatimonadota bacterium]
MSGVVVALWGGVIGLDETSFAQLMLSRPLLAGGLTGLLFGRPVAGMTIGLLLEAFALVILPIGAARYPEAGTATVAATAAYVETAGPTLDPGLALLAVVFALVWEWLAGASVTGMRRVNEWLTALPAGAPAARARALERRHLAAVGLDFVRAAVVTVTGFGVASVLLRAFGSPWPLGPQLTRGLLTVAATAMLGAALPVFGGWVERRLPFLVGILCGSLLLLLR